MGNSVPVCGSSLLRFMLFRHFHSLWDGLNVEDETKISLHLIAACLVEVMFISET